MRLPLEGDEVDRILQAWRRQRPDLDVSPLAVLSRVTRLAHHLDRARSAAFSRHGLEGWEFDVLAALRRAGDDFRLTPTALATGTLVTTGTMTNRIDRLAERGLVVREPHPGDGRAVMVRLTARGRRCVDDALTDLLAHERSLLGALAEEERELLASLLARLLLSFETD